MNDSGEYIYPTKMAAATLMRFRPNVATSPQAVLFDKLLENLALGLNIETAHPIFLASLSEHKNDLSQWRAYGGPEGGISIGFSWHALAELYSAPVSSRFLLPCIYDPALQQAVASTVITAAFRVFGQVLAKYNPPNVAAFAEQFAFLFFREAALLASITKHPSFAAEREWRVTEFMTLSKLPAVQFHGKPNHVAPAVLFDLGQPPATGADSRSSKCGSVRVQCTCIR